jgi:radical SAM superfamily enzyme YgiQ (UPF0313 family)
MFRPPGEADSLVLQIDEGCPHNLCSFCGMYKDVPYRRRPLPEVFALAAAEAAYDPGATRIFLADGDVMARPADELLAILRELARLFPALRRVSLYANGSSIAARTDAQLAALRAARLHTLYMGLESGDPDVLARCGKRETPARMTDACRRAQAAGLRVSVMILLGLGGREGSARHAAQTAAALNAMQPRLLSALRVIPVPGTAFHAQVESGRIAMLSQDEVVREMRALVRGLALEATVFRANHSSNVVPLEARFPRDKDRLLAELDDLIGSGGLDRHSPGAMPLWL